MAARKVGPDGDFYAKLDEEIERSVFTDFLEGCADKDVEYSPDRTLEWMLSLAGKQWGAYRPGGQCVGYCKQLGEYGVVNATEKLKISLYISLYLMAHEKMTPDDALSAMGIHKVSL